MSYYKNRPAADFKDHRRRCAHVIVYRCAGTIRRVTADDTFQFVGAQIAKCQIHGYVPPSPNGINRKISWINLAVNGAAAAERVNFLHSVLAP